MSLAVPSIELYWFLTELFGLLGLSSHPESDFCVPSSSESCGFIVISDQVGAGSINQLVQQITGRMKRVIDLLQGELTLGLVNGGGLRSGVEGGRGVNLGAVEMTRSMLQEQWGDRTAGSRPSNVKVKVPMTERPGGVQGDTSGAFVFAMLVMLPIKCHWLRKEAAKRPTLLAAERLQSRRESFICALASPGVELRRSVSNKFTSKIKFQ